MCVCLLVVESLAVIHKTLGPDYGERVLPSIGNEILKAVVVSVCLQAVTACLNICAS